MIVCMARHFYRMKYPNQAKDHDRSLSNAFVAFTHMIGLSKYFSFTPLDFDRDAWRTAHEAGNKKDYDHTTNTPNSQ